MTKEEAQPPSNETDKNTDEFTNFLEKNNLDPPKYEIGDYIEAIEDGDAFVINNVRVTMISSGNSVPSVQYVYELISDNTGDVLHISQKDIDNFGEPGETDD